MGFFDIFSSNLKFSKEIADVLRRDYIRGHKLFTVLAAGGLSASNPESEKVLEKCSKAIADAASREGVSDASQAVERHLDIAYNMLWKELIDMFAAEGFCAWVNSREELRGLVGNAKENRAAFATPLPIPDGFGIRIGLGEHRVPEKGLVKFAMFSVIKDTDSELRDYAVNVCVKSSDGSEDGSLIKMESNWVSREIDFDEVFDQMKAQLMAFHDLKDGKEANPE